MVDDQVPGDLAEVGVYATSEEGFQHSLVVLAMGRACWLVESPVGHRLLVEPDVFGRAREQFARYDRESMNWPPPPIAVPATHAVDFITPLLWALVVFTGFNLQAEHHDWTSKGALDAAAIFEGGEWWRVATALFLHADAGHAISNALSGLLVFSAMVQVFGWFRGWMLVAAASLAGNLAVAAINYPGPYRSLGASTAIFAGIGLLTGRSLRVVARSNHAPRWRELFVPLASGMVVLALYGTGGVQIDIGAHVTGFGAGLAAGFLAALRPGENLPRTRN